MSLINQVLKDLDQKRGPADGLQVAALQGIGLVQSKHTRWTAMLTTGAWGLALVLIAFMLFQFAGGWIVGIGKTETEPMFEPVPVAKTHAQLETLDTTPLVVPAPEPVAPVAPVAPSDPALESAAAVIDEPVAVTRAVQTPAQPIKTLSARQHAEHEFAAAQKAMDRQNKLRAEQLFNSALDYQPQHMDARIQLAAIYLERNNNEAAERVLEDGLALDPTHIQLTRLYAQLLATRGEFEMALQVLAAVTDAQTHDAESLALRAAVYARLNNHHDAASSYRLALKLDPGQANWWMGLGLALEHQQLYSSAADAYQMASRLPLADNVKTFVHQRLQQLQNTAGDN